ncbi:MAG: hypothetical protein JNM56_25570 [Planctomycetia bacterium]|nr:hypothetical protein [Planctomycetia bacterium]
MSVKDPLLTKNVALAKHATAEHPLFFTLVLKGGSDGALLLSRKKGTANDIKVLKEKCHGTAVVRGRCYSEEGKLVFETAKPPASATKVLKLILHRETGLTLPIETRMAKGPDDDEPEVTDGEPQEGAPETGDEVVPEEKKQPAPIKKGTNIIFTQARLVWDATRKSVQSQLQGLEKQIITVCKQINDDPNAPQEIDLDALTSQVKTIYTILDRLDQRLIDKLDDALNASDPAQREELHREAKGILDEYEKYVTDDPLFNAIDNNGFMPTTLRKSVLAAVQGLASKL